MKKEQSMQALTHYWLNYEFRENEKMNEIEKNISHLLQQNYKNYQHNSDDQSIDDLIVQLSSECLKIGFQEGFTIAISLIHE